MICFNNANHDGSGSYSETFPIAAPPTVGTYNAYFVAYSDDSCSNQASNTFTRTSGVVVNSNAAPTLTAISPNTGNRLQTLNVLLTGTNFGSVTSVNFGSGITVNSTTVDSATQITAGITITSAAATGARTVTVSNPAPGGGTSGGQTFTVSNPAPTLTARTPISGNRLQTLNVVLTGTGFIAGGSTVNFSGSGITTNTTTVDTATQITVNISIAASAATGNRNITVTNPAPGGGTSGALAFAVQNPPPTLTAVSPVSGARNQTLDVELTGSNFIAGVTTVSFGANITVNTTTVDDPTQITANITIAVGAALGARNVSVTNPAPGGGTATLNNGFTVTAANTAPTVAADNASRTFSEGQTATNTGTYSDPNAGDNVSITASVGTVTKTGTNSGTWSWSFATTDGPNQSQTATITANDGVAPPVTTTFSLTVNNVAPSIGISGAANVNEGSPYSLTLGSVTDPGSDTVTSYIVHWGDGSTDTYATNGAKTHTYADGPANCAITVDLVDEDGTFLDRANASQRHGRQRGAQHRHQRRCQRQRGLALQPDPGQRHRSGQRHGHQLHRALG